jgi:hypothetical protein
LPGQNPDQEWKLTSRDDLACLVVAMNGRHRVWMGMGQYNGAISLQRPIEEQIGPTQVGHNRQADTNLFQKGVVLIVEKPRLGNEHHNTNISL